MKYIFALVFLSIFQFNVFAQSATKIDSLQSLILKSGDDSNKVNLYYELARQYEYFNSKERIEYLFKAVALANQINFTRGIHKYSHLLITILFHRNMYDLSMQYCLKYLEYLERNNFEVEKNNLYNTLGNLYGKREDYKTAYTYYQKAKQHYVNTNNKDLYGSVLNNISILKFNLNELDSSLHYSNLAIEQFSITENISAKANSMLLVSSVLLKKGNAQLAFRTASEALNMYEGIDVSLGIVNAKLFLGEIMLYGNKPDSALLFFESSKRIADSLNILSLLSESSLLLSKSYAQIKKYDKAYEYRLIYGQYSDSLALSRYKEKMLEMDVKYELSKIESALTKSVVEKQRQTIVLWFVVVLLILVFVFALYVFRTLKITRSQKKIIEIKQKEILDSIHYAKRIQKSLLTPERYILKKIIKLKKDGH